MLIKKSEFIISAVSGEQYPPADMPEVAFVGRSNVGKSSIINSLLNRKKLVKVSSTPGKTRLINFFKVNDEFMLVDLPGYGYAAVSQSEKKKWGDMIEEYLKTRDNLTNVVLLVDIRHKPTADDHMMYDFIKYYRSHVVVVCTKLDKIGKNSISKQVKMIKTELGLDVLDTIVTYSSLNNTGRDELWKILIKQEESEINTTDV